MGHHIYHGFADPPDVATLIDAVLYDAPESRWRAPRALARIEDSSKRAEAMKFIAELLQAKPSDWKTSYRLFLARKLLNQPMPPSETVIIRGKGAFTQTEFNAANGKIDALSTPTATSHPYPIVDFHVHPKLSDGPFLADLSSARISHAVILATDTDPEDIQREDIRENLIQKYIGTQLSVFMSFPEVLNQLQKSLYSPSHTTNQDVADWVNDYPDQLIGFGSVNLSKPRDYVEHTLEQIISGPFRGIKLLPFSQFFDPSTNENLDLLMSVCEKHHLIVLTHTGCAAGIFEDPQFNSNSRPILWTTVAERHPDVPIVLAHFGAYSQMYPGIWFDEAIEMMYRYDNLYADTAAVWGLLQNETIVKKIRSRIGFDRVLFGTDYPMPTMMLDGTKGVVSSLLTNSLLSEQETCEVMSQNAVRLLGLCKHCLSI